jgi:hypothetical protein
VEIERYNWIKNIPSRAGLGMDETHQKMDIRDVGEDATRSKSLNLENEMKPQWKRSGHGRTD